MWEVITSYWHQIPDWIKNRYFLLITTFAFILIFIDTNNVFQLIKRQSKLHQLHKQEIKFNTELIELEEQKDAFDNDLQALEKFAREEYRMKKSNEEVYVIVHKGNK